MCESSSGVWKSLGTLYLQDIQNIRRLLGVINYSTLSLMWEH